MTKMRFSQDRAREDVVRVYMAAGFSMQEALERCSWVEYIPEGTEFLFPDGEDWAMYPFCGKYLRVHRDCCVGAV